MAEKIDTEDLVTCPICFEQFSNPKCLPCLHTFCHSCLRSYIITQHGGEGRKAKEFPCPVCRQEVAVTDVNLTSEKITDTMPGNHLIISLIDRSGGSDKDKDKKLCVPCNFDGEKSDAVSWCSSCSEPLCENCVKYHKRFNTKSKHEIIPIGEMPKEKSANLLEVDEPCMKHSGKVLEVYCVDHKELCCVICLATLHRKCEHISTFEEMVSRSKGSGNEELFTDFLTEMEKKTDCLRIKTDENLTSLNNRHGEISKQVTTTVQQAKDKLDHLQSSFLTKLQQKHKEESVKLTETIERIEIFYQNVKRAQKLLQTVREQGSPKQVFITKEKLKVQFKHHMEGLKSDLKGARCIDYVLNTDGMVTSILNTLTSVAEIDIKVTSELSTILNEVSHVLEECLYKEEQAVDFMALEVNEEKIVSPGCNITGGTYLPDGRLVLCCYDINKLKFYDKTGCYLFEIEAVSPVDACLLPSAFAVSFNDENYIIKYEIQQDTIKEIGKIPCKNGPWGLASTKDNIVVGYENEVDLLSIDGKVLQNFSRNGDTASYVAISLTGHVYYIDGDDVVCLDGKEMRRYTNPEVKDLSGIAVDRNENVYVCGYQSDNVCLISYDGQISKILHAKIPNPYCIGINDIEMKIYIGLGQGKCHFYSLKRNC